MEEVSDSGFLGSVPTLQVQLLTDDSLLQVRYRPLLQKTHLVVSGLLLLIILVCGTSYIASPACSRMYQDQFIVCLEVNESLNSKS